MTSQKKDKLVIAEHGVITQEALLAYLNDELSVEQRTEVDRLLKDDPFAQDALEGLRTAQDRPAIKTSLSAVHKKVRERSGGKKEVKLVAMHWSNYAYAAVILGVLISVGFVLSMYMSKKDDTLAQKKPLEAEKTEQTTPEIKQAPPAETAITTNDSATIVTEPVSTPPVGNTGNESVTNNGLASNGTVTTTPTKATDAEKTNAKPVVNDKDKLAGNTKTPSATVSPDKNATMSNSTLTATGNNNVASTTEDGKKRREDKAETGKVSLDDAMKSFSSGDYKNAADQFDAVLKDEPDNAEALFFGGVSDYVQNDLKASEKSFDKLLKKGTKFVDGSKWYKANILLKKGKKEEAKKLLEELSMTKGSYNERAKKKLADSGF